MKDDSTVLRSFYLNLANVPIRNTVKSDLNLFLMRFLEESKSLMFLKYH